VADGEWQKVLGRLNEEQPEVLVVTPGPGSEPPFSVTLAAWGAGAAAELHERFGEDVRLTVGFLPYPPGRETERPVATPLDDAAPLDSGVASVELDGPAAVRSGHALTHGLLVANRSGAELTVATNGVITASVVDPGSGEVVGGYAGWQTAPLITFAAGPGETVRIPLLIGTASVTPRLGYTVPPGTWGLRAALDLRDGGRMRTPVLPLQITP